MTTYHLIFDDDLRQEMNRLSAEYKRDPNSPSGREYVGVINAMKALQSGREDAYVGKQLGYGPDSHDLRDCAELKVPVVDEFTPGGFPRGPSHRLVYREFDPLPTVQDGRVVPDPTGTPYRHVISFGHRKDDPAATAGERLGRQRGEPARELYGLTGGGRPSVGPQRDGAQTTPVRLPMPPDLMQQAGKILQGSPPAGTAPRPAAAPQANIHRPPGPGTAKSKER
ncbi:hypothetical protein [Kribbella sp. HUAS MG21]|uniref:Uncharacterized protein n=1 Tax=Kribbella sp. HUAS MG21 TaxID=3160966 RepID=A0AAU7TCC7_9ACTN